MRELNRMCEVVTEEIGKIADKGLNSVNLETAYRLIDILKDIKTIEAMESGSWEREEEEDTSALGMIMRGASPEERMVLQRYADKLKEL